MFEIIAIIVIICLAVISLVLWGECRAIDTILRQYGQNYFPSNRRNINSLCLGYTQLEKKSQLLDQVDDLLNSMEFPVHTREEQIQHLLRVARYYKEQKQRVHDLDAENKSLWSQLTRYQKALNGAIELLKGTSSEHVHRGVGGSDIRSEERDSSPKRGLASGKGI